MSVAPPALPEEPCPRGYVSQDSKRRFTIVVGTLAAIFFIAQFALPMIVMMVAMPLMGTSMFGNMTVADADSAALWEGRIWFIEEGMTMDGPNKAAALKSVAPGDEDVRQEAEVALSTPRLLAGRDRLWIISSEGVMSWKDGMLTPENHGERRGDTSRPFLVTGRPAVVERSPAGYALYGLQESGWQKLRQLPRLTRDKAQVRVESDLRIVSDGDTHHVFMKFGGSIYYLKDLPPPDFDVSELWQLVRTCRGNWYATVIEGQPMVFAEQAGSNSSTWASGIEGLQLQAGNWVQAVELDQPMMGQLGVFPGSESGRLLVLVSGMPGSLRLIESKDGAEVSNTRYGRGSPFPPVMMGVMFVPYGIMLLAPFILAFIYTVLMRKHRVCHYHVAGGDVPFASLARRALAQLVDGVIAGGPTVTGYVLMMSSMFDMESMITRGPFFMMGGFGLVFGGLLWAFVCFLVFAFTEGLWGRTPGKWIMGIRVVGTDLTPCGFGRALLRGILKFADGFFNFMVGVMIVALTENWQRVGDMVARTIVIDTRGVSGKDDG